MGNPKSIVKLNKFIDYMLARRPDEFGLIPDGDGFVKVKDLLRALAEEEGWRHVRQSHLNEVLMTVPDPAFEIVDNAARSLAEDAAAGIRPALDLPKLLYTCVRPKAYAVVLEKGLQFPQPVVLSPDQELALRIGSRKDASPVLLTVQVAKSQQQGVAFRQLGELIFLADAIPPDCFTGPPLDRVQPPVKKPETSASAEEKEPFMPGSFLLDLEFVKKDRKGKFKGKPKGEQKSEWKHNKKKIRRRKEENWPDF